MPDTVLISTVDTKGHWNSHKWRNTMDKCCSELQMAWVGARVETGRLMEGYRSSSCWMRPWKEEIRKILLLKERIIKKRSLWGRNSRTWWLMRCSELREKESRFTSGFQPGKWDWSIFMPFIVVSYLYRSLWQFIIYTIIWY